MEHKTSFWIDNNETTSYPTLNENKNVDICIIGGGLTGLSTAYYLSKTHRNIVLLEADKIGQGASGRSTGKVSSLHGAIYQTLLRVHGQEKAYAYYEANEEAIESIEAIIKEHNIQCHYERGTAILYAESVEYTKTIADEIEALEILGIPYEIIREDQYKNCLFGVGFKKQGMFDPYAYALSLGKICSERGIQIFEHSPVSQMKDHELTINGHTIQAKTIVYATQVPLINDKHFYFSLMTPYQSSLCVMKADKKIPEMFINCDQVTKTLRTIQQDHQSYLMVGGYEHKTGDRHAFYESAMMEAIKQQFPTNTIVSLFSSQDMKTHDSLPLIGVIGDDPNILFASGYNKWGNTNSNVAGKLLAAMILKAPTPLKQLFDPHRTSLIFNRKFMSENAAVGISWIQSKFAQEQDQRPERNQATTFKIDGHPYGVYCNEQDEVFYVDLICPHLGCTLSFNESEKTWDCPCHGSRFDVNGSIIKGPAIHPLNTSKTGFNQIDPKL